MYRPLVDWFKMVMPASGTPANYQKALAREYGNNIECNFYEAVQNKYIVRPTLNLCRGFKENLPSVIKAIYEHEVQLRKEELARDSRADFDIRILVNMMSIEDIHTITRHINIPGTHTLVIHSDKAVDGEMLLPEIDGQVCSKEDVFTKLEEIDAGIAFTGEPVFIFQVDMLSEGINIKSVSACVVQSSASVKIMQQCGRPVRNQIVNGLSKIDYGHASIYCLLDNELDVVDLLEKLTEFSLNDEVFKWGCGIESTGGVAEADGDIEKGGLTWKPLPEVEIKKWKLLFGNKKARSDAMDIPDCDLDDDFIKYLSVFNTSSGKNEVEQLTKKAELKAEQDKVAEAKAEKEKESDNPDADVAETVLEETVEDKIEIIKVDSTEKPAIPAVTEEQGKKARKQIGIIYTELRKLIEEQTADFSDILEYRDLYLEYYFGNKVWADNWKNVVEKCPSLDETQMWS